MDRDGRRFGVVQWSSETGEHLAAPGESERLMKHRVGGRVAMLVGNEGKFQKIKLGDNEFRISRSTITPVDNVMYAIGDAVLYNGKRASVRDVIWHYAKGEPFYLLDVDGKKSSKRYFGKDLQ